MAWLNDDEDDIYQFDNQPSMTTPRGGNDSTYQPTPPPAPKPGGAPIAPVSGRSPQPEWLHDGPTPPAKPQPPTGNGSFASPGRAGRITSPQATPFDDDALGGKKKSTPDPFAESDDGDTDLTATPPPPPVQTGGAKGKTNPRQGASREGRSGGGGGGTISGEESGGNISYSDSGATPINGSTAEKKEKKEKKSKHKNGEVLDIDLKAGDSGNTGGAAPPEALLRRLEKAAKKPKKEKKEKKDDASPAKPKKEKIARPKPTRPTVDQGGENGTFLTEKSGVPDPTPIGVGVGIEDQGKEVDLSIVPDLSEEDKSEFKAMIQFSSLEVVAKLRSPKFQHRAMAVTDLTQVIIEKMKAKPTQAISMAFALWRVTVVDKVVQVFTTASESVCNISKVVLAVDEDTLSELLPTIEALSLKLRDSNARTKTAAMSALEALSNVRSVGPLFIVQAVCEPAASAATAGGSPSSPTKSDKEGDKETKLLASGASNLESWKAILARIEYLTETTKLHGEKLIKLAENTMISQAVIGLKCTNANVRKASIGFTTKLYAVVGAGEMDTRLTTAGVSPAVMKVLKEALEGSNVLGGVDTSGTDVKQEEEDMASFDAENVQLSEEMQMIINQWTQVTGIRSVKCLFCPRWKIRERFIGRLHTLVNNSLIVAQEPGQAKHFDKAKLLNIKDETVKVVLSAMCEKALTDSVPNVLQAAQLLTKTTVSLMEVTATKDFFATFAAGLMGPLVRQAGLNSNNEDVCEHILISNFAKHPKLGPKAIFNAVTDPAGMGVAISKVSVKLLVPRLDLLTSLIDNYGFDGARPVALNEDDVMSFTMKAFEHPQQKARVAAVNVIVAVYKKAGNVIQPYLSQLKGALLEDLKSKIAGIARKERSSTAPIQRLAGIVEPLGDSSPLGGAGGGGADTARPSTNDPSMGSTRTAEDPSMREKITKWHASKKIDDARKHAKQNGGTGGEETLEDIEDDNDSNSDADNAMDNAPVLNKDVNTQGSKGVLRPGAARKTRLVFS